ncbi:MAG TPA: 50S ribosomal protein L21 [Actinomycetota bacterium]
MYAIIRAGGHQEKVSPGEQITIDRRKEEVGSEITFTPLLVSTGEQVVSDKKALAEGEATVVGTILDHLKGDKVDVFNYRNKTGYRRHTGHRQPLTLVEIAEIRFGGKVEKAPEEPAPAPAAEEKAAPAKKTAAKKPAAEKPAAKKPAAKKTTAKKPAAKKTTAKAGAKKTTKKTTATS